MSPLLTIPIVVATVVYDGLAFPLTFAGAIAFKWAALVFMGPITIYHALKGQRGEAYQALLGSLHLTFLFLAVRDAQFHSSFVFIGFAITCALIWIDATQRFRAVKKEGAKPTSAAPATTSSEEIQT